MKGLDCSKRWITGTNTHSHQLVKEGFREEAKHFDVGTLKSGTLPAFGFGEEALRLDFHRLNLQA